jgi:hypothetical protein
MNALAMGAAAAERQPKAFLSPTACHSQNAKTSRLRSAVGDRNVAATICMRRTTSSTLTNRKLFLADALSIEKAAPPAQNGAFVAPTQTTKSRRDFSRRLL